MLFLTVLLYFQVLVSYWSSSYLLLVELLASRNEDEESFTDQFEQRKNTKLNIKHGNLEKRYGQNLPTLTGIFCLTWWFMAQSLKVLCCGKARSNFHIAFGVPFTAFPAFFSLYRRCWCFKEPKENRLVEWITIIPIKLVIYFSSGGAKRFFHNLYSF